MVKLTPTQRRHIIELLERGESLPRQYQPLLFPLEPREHELVYAGKEPEEEILAGTVPLTLQPIRIFGNNNGDWYNMLIFGDNLQGMKVLLEMKERGQLFNADGSRGIRLIYIDPPFGTHKDFTGSQEEKAYQDKIIGARFVEFMRKRLIIMRELLSPDGSIYVHLDERKSHYIKVIMDEVFGEHRFQREIVWRIGWLSGFKTQAKNWIRNHDVLLFYTMSPDFVFNKIYLPYPDGYVRRNGTRSEGEGYPLEDTWNCCGADRLDSIQIMSFSGEKTGFPNQKNENLLERIIRASSNEGDLVLDAFAGSGTTLAVAEKLGRRWIGIDCGKFSLYTIQKRMLNLRSEIGNKGKPLKPRPFILYNTVQCTFPYLKNLPWEKWRFLALKLFQCEDKPHEIGGIQLDGYRNGGEVLVFNPTSGDGVMLDYGFIDDLHARVEPRAGARFFIIAPASRVAFMEDYVDKGYTRYHVLRIPNSLINELCHRYFGYHAAVTQPAGEAGVNELVEAAGFDFIRPPQIACKYFIRQREGGPSKEAVVKIETFQSGEITKRGGEKVNLEALSMVLVDYDYPYDPMRKGKEPPPPFRFNTVFYAKEIEAAHGELRLPFNSLGKNIMLIYIDIYGNEFTEVKAVSEFSRVLQ